MSDSSAEDLPVIGISSEETELDSTRDLSRASGVLIESEREENIDFEVQNLEIEAEGGGLDEEANEIGSNNSISLSSSSGGTGEVNTQTSITELLNLDFENIIGDSLASPLVTTQPQAKMANRFRKTARSDEAKVIVDVIRKAEERHKMSDKEKAKLREDAVKGMETKFEMIELFSQTDSIEHLETINDVALMIGDVTKRLRKYDMMEVFKLHLPSEAEPTTPRKSVDLIKMYATTTLEEVCESVEFYRTWGQDFDLENINWTQEYLENSCENDLRVKVLEQMNVLPEVQQGGPVFFKIMMKLVTTTTDNAIRALTKRVLNLDLKTIPGENVSKVTSLIRATLQRLETVGKTPPDMAYKLLEVFQTSSLDKFNKVFENLELMIKINMNDEVKYTPDKILTLADMIYADLAEHWPHDSKSVGSSFNADSDIMSRYDCWNCGKKGHLSRDCPTKGSNSGGRGYSGGRGTVAGVEDLLVAVDVDLAEETKVQLRRRLLGTKSHLQRENPMKS